MRFGTYGLGTYELGTDGLIYYMSVNILYTIYRSALLGFKLWQNGSA